MFSFFFSFFKGLTQQPTIYFNGNQGVSEESRSTCWPVLIVTIRNMSESLMMFLCFLCPAEDHDAVLGEQRRPEGVHLQRDQRRPEQSAWQLRLRPATRQRVRKKERNSRRVHNFRRIRIVWEKIRITKLS